MNYETNKHSKNKSNKSERGYWEYSRFQKNENDINEQYIKSKCPSGNFDHHKIKNLMYPIETREELLIKKFNSGGKLKSDEKIIVNNILDKKRLEIENDNLRIDKFGLNTTDINTDEGRVRKLLLAAESKIKSKEYEMLYYINQKINEFNIPNNIKKKYSNLLDKINELTGDLDKIKLQFTKFHSNMPPLNHKGFKDLDPFQKDVIRNIDNNINNRIGSNIIR